MLTNKYKYFLSIVMPIKNENDYLDDYIKYYTYHGVDHFYFYDNDSDISARTVLAKYSANVTVIDYPGKGVQYQIYEHFRANYSSDSKWVAIIDIDEFIFPKKHLKLIDFLEDYESYDAIAINWLMFGDGHHKKKVSGPLIKNYLYNEGKQHPNFKTIYKSDAIREINHSHFGKLKWFKKYIDPKFNKVKNVENNNFTIDIIQVNHYFSRSEEEYFKKINSTRVDNGNNYVDHKESHSWIFDEHIRDNAKFDDEIWQKYGFIYESNLLEVEK